MMDYFIETPRLYIRELLPADDAAMFEMDSDAEVHRYLGNKPQQHIGEARDVIAMVRQQYADFGIGRWAVVEKETGGFIGWTGFKRMTDKVNGHVGHYDFGYRHLRRAWGRGFAYEAARAALDYGIDQLDIRKDIYAMTDVDNGASRHLLEKLGFRLGHIFAYDGPTSWLYGAQPTTWYVLEDERLG